MTKADVGAESAVPAARRWIWLVAVLVLVGSSRLPVQPSTARFGSYPSKKSKTCPAEQSVRSLSAGSEDRTLGFVKGHPPADRGSAAEPSGRGISQVVEARLLLGSRRPDYLNSFAASSAHGDLPPPRA